MAEPVKNPFDLLLDQIRAVVREEIKAASKDEPKLLYNTKEAARLCNVPATWLASAAREKKVNCRHLGSYVRFALEDLQELIEATEQKKTCTPGIPVVYTSNDGNGTKAAKEAAQDDTGPTRGGDGDAEKLNCPNGTRGKADHEDHGISR